MDDTKEEVCLFVSFIMKEQKLISKTEKENSYE